MAGGLSLGDFKRGNIWITLAVVSFVGVLIFIPDMIGFRSRFADTDGDFKLELPIPREEAEKPRAREQTSQEFSESSEEVFERDLEHRDPLEQVSLMVNSGYADHLAMQRALPEQTLVTEEAGPSESKRRPGPWIKPKSREPETSPPFLARDQIAWDNLESGEARRTLREARGNIHTLLQNINEGDDIPESRIALFQLAAAIDQITNDGPQLMTAKEAVDYLEHLDLEVTRTMIREKARRDIMIAWADISLSDVLRSSRSELLKRGSVPRFDPELRLTEVSVTRSGGDPSRRIANGSCQVSFRGSLQGREISKVEFYRNGVFWRQARLTPHQERKGGFLIDAQRATIVGVFSIHVFDRRGVSYRQDYLFCNRASALRWQKTSGNDFEAIIPFNNPQAVDPRLDAFFRFVSTNGNNNFIAISSDGRAASSNVASGYQSF